MKVSRGYIGALIVALAMGGIMFAATPPRADTPVCDTPAQKAACQAQYDQLQQEIAQYQKVIDDTKAKEKSLQGDVTTLNAQINKAQAEINQRTITINKLNSEINQKTEHIQTLE